ncbi:MAG: hypothetical protein K0U84_24530 [Actinomycetia bacterium]|nr:hypothetical protein [Actinomycetes bacterium]
MRSKGDSTHTSAGVLAVTRWLSLAVWWAALFTNFVLTARACGTLFDY